MFLEDLSAENSVRIFLWHYINFKLINAKNLHVEDFTYTDSIDRSAGSDTSVSEICILFSDIFAGMIK